MSEYKLLKPGGVQRLSDNACIPPTLDNVDWQRYQEWLALGNTPDPQDPDPVMQPAQPSQIKQLALLLASKNVITPQDAAVFEQPAVEDIPVAAVKA
jgi:hypothetical protein